jgi:tetratricopeptide (TPR) repeat protein
MGEHRFTDALINAENALAAGTGDLSPFAIVGDAYADMGEYDKARDAYDRLSSREAYARDSRIAFLSFVHGDTTGAVQRMTAAITEATASSVPAENLAWLWFERGEFAAQSGDAAAADAAYLTALKIHPGDYRALAGLARLRANLDRTAEAIELYQHAIAVVPMPTFIAELGDLYRRTGNSAEAKKQYDLVEYIGKLGEINQVLHNRDLALFYADHGIKLGESLALARKEFEVRHDIYTWDALAWSLFKNGQTTEADHAIDQSLRYGTRDALLHFHAGMIAEKLGDGKRARSEFETALEINPRFHALFANEARQELARLDAGSVSNESAVARAR